MQIASIPIGNHIFYEKIRRKMGLPMVFYEKIALSLFWSNFNILIFSYLQNRIFPVVTILQ